MKDLKHIHYYEKLLEETANELVLQEKEAGGIAAGYTCYYVPEVLLNCGKAFSVRLRAPNTGSLDISQYYMSSFICGYTRALFERAFEGGMNYLDFYASSDTCQQMVRVIENIRDLVREYKADGIVIEQAKFCDFWGYERTLNTQVMQEEYGIPTLGIDREYVVRGSGQLATRMQAFVESLEIKKLRTGH